MNLREVVETARFDINAAVVFRLGEELITDVVQALVELVKNSYDADATWVKVAIDTHGPNKWGRDYADAIGVIRVEDNGQGMDGSSIRRGWLTIANSPKRDDKAAGRLTSRGRTPIGDKGLGRLGSQRLSRNVEIATRHYADPTIEYHVAFSWDNFRNATNLSEVRLKLGRTPVSGKSHGTTLVLSDLREPETWQGEENLRKLQRELSAMISPFQEASDFHVYLEVDGKHLELAEIAQRVRETALIKYSFGFDGKVFLISGAARLNYLQPNSRDDQRLLHHLCREDRGEALYEFLNDASGNKPSYFRFSERPDWFVEFGTHRALDDLDRVRRSDRMAINPGPFRGEVDVVSLDSSEFQSDVISRQSDYRRFVRELAGIRVYRDGFGIRVGEDWLELGKQWTRGSSYYGLRPANVLGYVEITARHNPNLVETTSREGFLYNPHYENFVRLLFEFVRFAGISQEYLRRGVLQFLNEHRDRRAGVEPEDSHSDITKRIGDVAEQLAAEKKKVEQNSGSLRREAAKASKTLRQARDKLGDTVVRGNAKPSIIARLEKEIAMVYTAAENADRMLEEVSNALDRASELNTMREVLDRRWETFHDEVSAFHESISLGLTAEVLSHEIHNIADRLAEKSAALLREIHIGARRSSMVAYIEHVRSSVATMRKQLTHLTPSLRYLRERKERIEMLAWVKELAKYHNEKLRRKGMKVVVVQTGDSEFAVNMNEGKLTQVFDNVVLNAEYWLGDAIHAGRTKNGVIKIVIDAPRVRISDSGRGVAESVEESLFEAFVTTKGKGQGRGLGLFVSRQLLDADSCSLVLLSERNVLGRRYVFELDLSGARCA